MSQNTGFTAIQFSDLHQNQRNELDIIVEYVKANSIDYAFFCGDAIGENHSLNNGIGIEHDIKRIAQNHAGASDLKDRIDSVIEEAYLNLAPKFQNIQKALNKEMYGVLGNHDFTPAYEILNSVTWVDTTKPVIIELDNGKKLAIAGNQNTYEVPKIYGNPELDEVKPFLKNKFINYNLGQDSSSLEEQLLAISDYETNAEVLKRHNHSLYSKIEELDDNNQLETTKENIQRQYDNLAAAEEQERKRLNSISTADATIFLTHKIASSIYGSGRITKEVTNYSNTQSTHGGHMHAGEMVIDGQVVSISDVLALIDNDQDAISHSLSRRNGQQTLQRTAAILQDRVRTENVDGEEISVIYIGDCTPEFNAGSGRFIVHQYDDNANWQHADIIDYAA